jgi:hypothetical protein
VLELLRENGTAQRFGLSFAGLSSGRGNLTWAQRDIWESVSFGVAQPGGWRTAPVYVWEFPLTSGPTQEEVLGALRKLVARHESLRTVFPPGAEGAPHQQVLGSGTIPVFMSESGHAGQGNAVERLKRQISLPEIGPPAGGPIRAAVTMVDGRASRVILCVPRLATDGWGLSVIADEIRRHVRGEHRPDQLVPSQPRKQADFEASTKGVALTTGAFRYWTHVLSTASRLGWVDRLGLRSAATYSRGAMTSVAVPVAVGALGSRYRATSSAVLLGAFTAALARLIGSGSYYLRLQASNRLAPEQRAAVCRTKQVALLPVELSGETVGDLIRDTQRRSFAAYRHARYDPAALRGPVAVLKEGPFFNFNDRRYADRPAAGAVTVRSGLSDLVAMASLVVETSENHALNPRIDFTIDSVDNTLPALRIGALANFLSADLVGALLTGLEAFLVEAAGATDDPAWRPMLDRCLG